MIFKDHPLSLGVALRILLATLPISVIGAKVFNHDAAAARSKPFKSSTVLKGSYIVEFEDVAAGNPTDFYSNLTTSQITAFPRIEFADKYFKGASFNLANSDDSTATVGIIQSMELVKSISPVRLYSRPASVVTTFNDTRTTSPATLQKRIWKDGKYEDDFPPHVMGNVDKLHAQNIKGQGMTIAIVDTGVDYTHHLLGSGIGPGHKFVYGTDLVGDAYNGLNEPIPKDDPMDCNGHGSHVSGIVGAHFSPELRFSGVAPEASFKMFKVFGCQGDVTNDVLIQAYQAAAAHGADVITASLGGLSGWSEDPWAVVVQRVIESGITCVLAAGNDGEMGNLAASGAADAVGAIAVGSFNVDKISFPDIAGYYEIEGVDTGTLAFTYTQGTNYTYPWGYQEVSDFGNSVGELYAVSLEGAVVGDACTALPTTTPNLSRYIVLIRRGGCTFDVKAQNVAAYNATRILYYNNVPTTDYDSRLTPLMDAYPDIPTGGISEEQGQAWLQILKSGQKITLTFQPFATAPSGTTFITADLGGGFPDPSTTIGPTNELVLKPDVSAPGGNIFSTYPVAYGGYTTMSGTSMASPYIAGVIALIKQVRGNISPAEIAALLSTTARPSRWFNGYNSYYYEEKYPAPVQGGGLVDALAAAFGTTQLSVPNLSFNDTSHFISKASFTIYNKGSKAVTYTFSNIPALTSYTLYADSTQAMSYPELWDIYATLRFEPASITIPAGGSGKVIVHPTRPEGLDETRLPIYSGWIAINGTDNVNLTLPYMGAAAKMKDVTVGPNEFDYPYLSDLETLGYDQWGDWTYLPLNTTTFTITKHSDSYQNLPLLQYFVAIGSPVVRIDIVPTDTAGVPRIIGQKALGSILGYPQPWVPRSVIWQAPWDGRLDDGTYVPEGEYRFFFRALRIFGDPTYDHDYDRAYSVPFSIKYSN